MIAVTCPDWIPSDNPHLTPETQPITISGARAILYRHMGPEAESGINQMAVARFGGHQYLFTDNYTYTSVTPVAQAQENRAIYQEVLHGFIYSGK